MTPSAPASADALDALSDDTLDALRARFVEVGFTAASLGRSESVAPGLFDAFRRGVVLWTLAQHATPEADLLRLFCYADAVPRDRVARVLTAPLAEALVRHGVLAAQGEDLVSNFLWMPFDALWVLSDDLGAGGDAVMGPGPTTVQLAAVMPARCPPSVLDVGCGAGTFALLAAHRGATNAVGVDINARAVTLARFNARLNRVSARFAAGDLFAPVVGERFDLIVAQPPFVASPPEVDAAVYLHGGAMGDELATRMVGECPDALAPGGQCLVLMDSPVRDDAPLQARLRAALGASPVDLLVLASPGNTPDLTAIGYASVGHLDAGEGFQRKVVAYRAHLHRLGIAELSHALVAVLAPTAPRAEARYTITLPVRSLGGFTRDDLSATLGALDLATADDVTLRRAAVQASPKARFVEERPRLDPSLTPRFLVRFERGGIGADRELSEAVWVLLGALDQCDSVDDAIDAYADACGATPAEVRGQVLGFVREQLARGVLVAR